MSAIARESLHFQDSKPGQVQDRVSRLGRQYLHPSTWDTANPRHDTAMALAQLSAQQHEVQRQFRLHITLDARWNEGK